MLGAAAMLFASGCISDLVNIGDGPNDSGGTGGSSGSVSGVSGGKQGAAGAGGVSGAGGDGGRPGVAGVGTSGGDGRGGSAGRGAGAGRAGAAGRGAGGVPSAGATGEAGSGGEPVETELCGSTFPGGITCSVDAACEALGCGQAWSLFDGEGCKRAECSETGECPERERCVPAPVGGKLDEHCFAGYDSCSVEGAACVCNPWEECGARSVCLPESEFPPASDCPVDLLDCDDLAQAEQTLTAYAEHQDWFFEPEAEPESLVALVTACREKVAALLASCP
jgi:hypothetical protein